MDKRFNAINRISQLANYGLDFDTCKMLLNAVDSSLVKCKFGESNVAVTAIMLNTWMAILDDYPMIQRFVLSTLKRRGLVATIGLCSDTAEVLIADADSREALHDAPRSSFFQLFDGMELGTSLQLLRFPKRFTLPGNDSVIEASLAKFGEINHKCIMAFRNNSKNTLLFKLLRYYTSEMLKTFDEEYEKAEPGFSSGSVLLDEGMLPKEISKRSIEAKCRGLAQYEPYLESPMYRLNPWVSVAKTAQYKTIKGTFSYGGAQNMYTHTWNARTRFVEGYAVEPIAVPKAYNKARIIAPEHPYAAYHLQKVRKAMEASLANSRFGALAPLHDADINRLLCRNASINHDYACVDMTSASDSESYWLANEILPRNVVKKIDEFRPRYVKLGNKYTLLGTYLTSGSPVCFITETIIILAAYLAGRDIAQCAYDDALLPPLVFGDDGLCDIRMLDTMYDVFEQMGMTVNPSKTYSGFFRENCGVEYLNGIPTKSTYWPRKALSLNKGDWVLTLKSLIDLQHRLFWKYPRASSLLEDYIIGIKPDMTFSRPGSVHDDLWSLVATLDDPASCNTRGFEGSYHYTLKPVYDGRPLKKWSMFSNTDMYAYYTFLKNGPFYEDPLMELLRVSSRPQYEQPRGFTWSQVLQPDD